MDFFKRRRILKEINTLDLIPVRICYDEEEDGKSVILVPKFKSKWIHNLSPVTRKLFYRVRLDQTGSVVWRNICGKRSIYELTSLIINKSDEKVQSPDEFLQRVSKFIMMLYERECISFRQLLESQEI